MIRFYLKTFIAIIGIIILNYSVGLAQNKTIEKVEEVKIKSENSELLNSADTIESHIFHKALNGKDSIIEEFGHSKLIAKTVYSYDVNQRLIEEREYVFDQENDSLYTYKYFYDKNDSLILEVEFTNGNIDGFIEYQYSDSHLIKLKNYLFDKSKEGHHDTLTFDTNGRIKTEFCQSFNSSHKYDEFGKKESICFWAKNFRQCWTYDYVKFDNQNNWIERREYLNGQLNYVVRRIIKYK